MGSKRGMIAGYLDVGYYELRVPETRSSTLVPYLTTVSRYDQTTAKGKRRRRVRPKMHATAARLESANF